MISKKLSTANARITFLSAMIAATGFELPEDNAEGTSERFTAFLGDKEKKALEPVEERATTAEGRVEMLGSAIEAAGVAKASEIAAAEDADALQTLFEGGVAKGVAKGVKQTGHEAVNTPPTQGNADSPATFETLEEARAALAEETDPVAYKKIYDRIQELKKAGE